VKEGFVGKFTWDISGVGGREETLTEAGFCICIVSRVGGEAWLKEEH
jgi:hypothetical protein